ncbi:hypothetical protein LTR53_002801 [Teratosphaeriaceae sp. CCFEE 6253]|nr:hypothetical protein LTR53_002801 [Teratosphaeriaceae sp. CCFEE 6253]
MQAVEAEVLQVLPVREVHRAVSIESWHGTMSDADTVVSGRSTLQDSCRRVDHEFGRSVERSESGSLSREVPRWRDLHATVTAPPGQQLHVEANDTAPSERRTHEDGSPDAQSATHEAGEREVIDAATILEFLAWGRRKQVKYVSHLPPCADDLGATVSNLEPALDHANSWPSSDGVEDFGSQLMQLQILLPDQRRVFELVQHHLDCLLWYHGSLHGPTFMRQLSMFYSKSGGQIAGPHVDLQWVALLFSVLTASVCCGTESALSAFANSEREILSLKWLQAVVTCLNAANWLGNASISSCQAISTLTISAHLLGFSNQQAVLLASATRIAQSLGLHRLDEASGLTVEVETGRRVWSQLCTQDWFSVPFADCYMISPLYSRSCAPLNCHDETLETLPAHEPTITSYCRFLNKIAELMPHLQDGLEGSNTLYTRYEQVLKYDKKMRSLATAERPLFLSNGQIQPQWPCYVPWARRAAAISSSHKIIMIHRKFLSVSFTNRAFDFSRRTCLAASKTILKEVRQAALEDGVVLWIYHAFSVAASITLCLDLLHYDQGALHAASNEHEHEHEHEQLVTESVTYLKGVHNSKIASRSARLLSDLLGLIHALRAKRRAAASRKRPGERPTHDPGSAKHHQTADVRSLLQDLQRGMETAGKPVPASTKEQDVATHATSQVPARFSPTSGISSGGGAPSDSASFGTGDFDMEAFAGADDIFSTLHAGFAGNSNDAFGSLLNISQSYNYI